jgi:6-phosphogluconolactonase
MRRFGYKLCAVLAFMLVALHTESLLAQSGDYFVYIGTYTGFKYVHHSKPFGKGESHSKGIYVARYHAATGELDEPTLAAETINPSFITISPDHRFLYAANEDPLSVGPPLDHSSYVSAFAIDSTTGKLKFLNSVPASGTSTCFISTDQTGKYVMVANFGSGSVSVLHVKEDGSLGELTSFIQDVGRSVNPSIQLEPHTHSILASPDNKYVIVSDLGLDKVLIFHFDDKTGRLTAANPAFAKVYPGSGPRHFMFHPSGKFGYQLTEMGGIVDVFAWDAARGTLTTLQRAYTVPHDFFGENHSAEIDIHPNGKFLYESNRRTISETERAPDTVGVFAIDSKGMLSPVQQSLTGGVMARSFALDPAGAYALVAGELSNNIVVFKIDQSTGRMTKTANEIKVDTPVCIKFVPTGPS